METIKRIYEIAKSNVEYFTKEIEGMKHYSILEKCNTVCYIKESAMSIACDDNGEPYMSHSIYPTQFTPEMADKICKNVSNGHGHKPMPISYKEFCELRLEYDNKILSDWEHIVRKLELA